MALNIPVLQTRTITAIVFVILMFAGLLINSTSFFILFSIIQIGCSIEYFLLAEKIYGHKSSKASVVLYASACYGIFLLFCKKILAISNPNFYFFVLALVIVALTILLFRNFKLAKSKSYLYQLLGLVYTTLSPGLLIHFYTSEYGLFNTEVVFVKFYLPLLIIASLWINDTTAYLTGSMIGKTPLSKISPKKTVEGTIGGALLAVGFIGFLTPVLFPNIFPFSFDVIIMLMLIACIVAVTGTIGDLFESKLKRLAGVKDSGSTMPGHGGFLDRFDSLLFAAPAIWAVMMIGFCLKK